MTRSTPARVATAAAALFSLSMAATPAAAVIAVPSSPFSALYVFGDSLSDAAGGSAGLFAPNEGGLPVTPTRLAKAYLYV